MAGKEGWVFLIPFRLPGSAGWHAAYSYRLLKLFSFLLSLQGVFLQHLQLHASQMHQPPSMSPPLKSQLEERNLPKDRATCAAGGERSRRASPQSCLPCYPCLHCLSDSKRAAYKAELAVQVMTVTLLIIDQVLRSFVTQLSKPLNFTERGIDKI